MIHITVFYYNNTDYKIHYSIKNQNKITCIITKYVLYKNVLHSFGQ